MMAGEGRTALGGGFQGKRALPDNLLFPQAVMLVQQGGGLC